MTIRTKTRKRRTWKVYSITKKLFMDMFDFGCCMFETNVSGKSIYIDPIKRKRRV